MQIQKKIRRLFTTIRHLVLWVSVPVQKFLQKMGRVDTKMSAEGVQAIINLMEPGDGLLSFESQRITNLFIRGDFKHAAIVSPTRTIIEAVGDNWVIKDGLRVNLGGVREYKDVISWLYNKDFAALVRMDLPQETRLAAAEYSKSFVGKGYDYFFNFKGELLYCSEIIYAAFKKVHTVFLNHLPEDKEILPQDFYDLSTKSEEKEIYLLVDTRVL